jgi:hypothetical protein
MEPGRVANAACRCVEEAGHRAAIGGFESEAVSKMLPYGLGVPGGSYVEGLAGRRDRAGDDYGSNRNAETS